MTQVYRTLRVAASDKGVLGVVMDAPMNLIGPELVRDPDYFVPHVDLTKVAEYSAEAATAARGW
jgi:hypothetical protein